VLTSGSVEEARALTLRALEAAARGGGFILGSSSEELYDAVPAANIIAMFETTWTFGHIT